MCVVCDRSNAINHKMLMREVCGHQNKTMANIFRKYAAVSKRMGEAQSSQKDYSMTRKEREWCVNSLSFLARDLSLKKLENLGFRVGESLYNSVKSFVETNEPIFATPLENYPGRKRHASATEIENVWMGCSQIVSRTNKDGENLRVTHGGKAKIARSIASSFTCSKNTAYRYCPPVVVTSRKHSDLCLYCEAIRKLRIECVRLANLRGGDFSLPGEHSGQGMVREPGASAANFLKPFASEDEEVEKLLGELRVLEWHEDLGASLVAEMKAAYGQKLVAVFDFSGNVELRGIRGDAKDFFCPPYLSLFGLMLITPEPEGRYKRVYINIFSFPSNHTSKIATDSLDYALELARAANIIPEWPAEMAFFSDKAKHFCSGEMAYGVLFEVSRNIRDVSYTYHACYHGKTALDGHFARTKQAIAEVAVEKWPNSRVMVENLVLESLRSIGGDGKSAFFPRNRAIREHRTKLILRNISCVQKLRRVTNGRPLKDELTVEGAPVKIRTRHLPPSESENENTTPDIWRKESASASELCDKIKKQQKKMAAYATCVYSSSSLFVF